MKNITEKYIKRSITLLRAAEGDAIEFAKIMDDMHIEIIKLINKSYKSIVTMNQLKILEKNIKNLLNEFYSEKYTKELTAISNHVMAAEIAWNASAIIGPVGINASDVVKPTLNKAIDSAHNVKYKGKTFTEWGVGAFGSNYTKIEKTLRLNFINGKSIAETVSEIRDFQRGEVSGLKSLTRSWFMHNSAEAKDQVFSLNPNIVEGSIWNSTLDSRTTPLICGVRDQKLYDNNFQPVGHSLPWIDGPGRAHFNCRSVRIPKLIGVDVETNRLAIGAGDEYERGDNVTRGGKVRKNSKANREAGIFDEKRVTTITEYEGFLKAQARKNIDFVADILNSKEDAILFRDGKVTLSQLAKESPVFNPTNRNKL